MSVYSMKKIQRKKNEMRAQAEKAKAEAGRTEDVANLLTDSVDEDLLFE